MTEIIKRCPFCGGREVEICRTNRHACWIRCADCGAAAQSDATRAGAIAFWNRRHIEEDGCDTRATVIDDGDITYAIEAPNVEGNRQAA